MYGNRTGMMHGTHPKPSDLSRYCISWILLKEGEAVTSVTGKYSHILAQLTFKTNLHRSVSASPGGRFYEPMTFFNFTGKRLKYLYGKEEQGIYALGVIFDNC